MTILVFCQNDYLIRGSFWQKDSLITHILFDLAMPILIFSPVQHCNEKSPCQTVHKNTVFFVLLLTYQELLYFNFCLDFHMVCMYFKNFQSASSIKSSNLSPDCVWQFIFRCFYSGFLCKYQDNKKGKQVTVST